MLSKITTLFSCITASFTGSKDFPYSSSSSTQLTSLWSYCKANRKVGKGLSRNRAVGDCASMELSPCCSLTAPQLLCDHVIFQTDQNMRYSAQNLTPDTPLEMCMYPISVEKQS